MVRMLTLFETVLFCQYIASWSSQILSIRLFWLGYSESKGCDEKRREMDQRQMHIRVRHFSPQLDLLVYSCFEWISALRWRKYSVLNVVAFLQTKKTTLTSCRLRLFWNPGLDGNERMEQSDLISRDLNNCFLNLAVKHVITRKCWDSAL